MMPPGARSVALVRGGQVDGAGPVALDEVSSASLVLKPLPDAAYDGWTGQPSAIYVRHPGCYAFQVDAPGFSETIVFAAQL